MGAFLRTFVLIFHFCFFEKVLSSLNINHARKKKFENDIDLESSYKLVRSVADVLVTALVQGKVLGEKN
jgi:hypothetical protein